MNVAGSPNRRNNAALEISPPYSVNGASTDKTVSLKIETLLKPSPAKSSAYSLQVKWTGFLFLFETPRHFIL